MSILPYDLIVCGITDPHTDTEKLYAHLCGFSDIIILIKNAINDMIVVSTLVVVGLLIFHGLKLITSFGNPSALSAAKKSLFSVITGYAVMLSAWVVVYTILSVLVGKGYSLLGN